MTIGALTSSEQEFLSRSVQGISTADFLPLETVVPKGISASSSIAKSDLESNRPQHRPTLSQPKNVMYDLLDIHLKTERLDSKRATIFDAEIAQTLQNIKKLEAEQKEALQLQAEQIKSQKTWSVLASVAQYLASAGVIVFGVATLPVAPWAGGLLIASGALGVGNQILHDTSLLDKVVSWWTTSAELQQKISRNIEMGMFVLQMGLGLAGGIWAYKAGSLTAEATRSAIAGITGVVAAGTRVGLKYHEKQISDLKAKLKELNDTITSNHFTMTTDGTEISNMLESTQSQGDEIRKAIQAFRVTPE